MPSTQQTLSQEQANNRLWVWCAILIIIASILTFIWFMNSCCSLSGNLSMIVNIVGSLLGICAAFLILRPHFIIDDIIVVEQDARVRVIVKNKHQLIELFDVKVWLDFCVDDPTTQNTLTWPILIEQPSISVLQGRRCGENLSGQTFHSQDGFVRDPRFQYIRCRASAQNSLSGVTRVIEKVFNINDVKYGRLINGSFMSYRTFYNHASTRIDISNEIENFQKSVLLSALCLPKAIYDVRTIQAARNSIERLQNQESLTFVSSSAKDFIYLKSLLSMYENIYVRNATLAPVLRDKRDELSKKINKYVVYLSFYAYQELNTKNN